MYEGREVFPNSPLEYVAAEVRYPYAPRLRQQDVRDAILAELEDLVPILRPHQRLRMSGIAGGPVSQELDQVTRAFNRASTLGVAVTTNALTVDTTSYEEFPSFRSILDRCVSALDKHASPAAVERVGLRFINEVRVPAAITNVRDWHGWITNALVDAAAVNPDHEAMNLEGVVVYTTGEHRSLTFRFAAAPEGSMIGNEPLKRQRPSPEGPFFALDLDSFWQPPLEASPAWAVEMIMAVLDQLHEPVGATFQGAITDKLRDTVLRGANDR
jgi:uncharacterized protein (TIGR04255 family)